MIEAIIAVTAATIIGSVAMIGFALRKLYRREGGSFASWHRRRLLAALGLAIPLGMVFPAIAIGFGFETAELSFIAAGSIAGGVVLWNQSRLRAKRGPALPLARLPERKPNRFVPVLVAVSACFLAASIVIDGSVTVLGIARVVGLVEVAVAGLLLRPETHQLFEGGVHQFRSFVPWTNLESYRYLEFENTAIYRFQLREPGWFRKEISVAVPRAEIEQMNQYLSRTLPCIGREDRRQIPSPAV